MPKYEGKLELTWTNKGQCLLAHEDGSYEWLPASDFRVAEVRLLLDVDSTGLVSPRRGNDNLLIEGDALHGLTSLIRLPEFREYVGNIKLAYLDPPFNTGQAFEHYDDGLEHSVWLTMMRDRLTQIRELLALDGSVWVHLDDAEVHRCRLLLDELFGVENYVGTVIWQKADGPRNDLPNFSVDHDNILVYRKSSEFRMNRGARDEALNSIYKSIDGDPLDWYDDNPTAPSAHRNQTWVYAIQSPITGDLMYPAKGRCWGSKQETIFNALSEYANYRLEVIEDDQRRADICGVPVDELRKGVPAILLVDSVADATASTIARKEAGPWPEYILRPKGTIGRKRYQPQTGVNTRTIWFNDEVGHNREAKAEIKALFPDEKPFSTPKPERLIRKILESATSEGEIVLDCFAGSGTTPAVAHKLGRKWIAIERSVDNVSRFAKPRLRQVIRGTDPGGISTRQVPVGDVQLDSVKRGDARAAARVIESGWVAGVLDLSWLDDARVDELARALKRIDRYRTEVLWDGGGGFRHLKVGPSMFEESDGLVFLADGLVDGALAEATAAQLGFEYDDQPPFSGRKGRLRLAVVDGVVSEGVVKLLVAALADSERVVICGTGVDPAARPVLSELRPGSTLRKIPSALLDRYRSATRQPIAASFAVASI